MSSRLVLGVVSQNVSHTHKNANKQAKNKTKQNAKATAFNDENKYAKQQSSSSSSNNSKKSAQLQNNYEFEIFEEENCSYEKPVEASSTTLDTSSSKAAKKNNKKLRESDPSVLQAACLNHSKLHKPSAIVEITNKENDFYEYSEVDLEENKSCNSSFALPMLDESTMNSSSADMTCSPAVVVNDTIKFESFEASHCGQDELESDDDSSNSIEFEFTESEQKRRAVILDNELSEENCDEYKAHIIAYMHKMEREYKPKANYMRKQQDISHPMRMILVDWLVEVSEEYQLHPETLYLSVNYVDRFLSQMSVLRGKLQLVGTAAMYIASKYEEITPPDVAEFVYITDDTYTKKQVLRMEHLMLKVLDFRMNAPTASNYMSHFLRMLRCGEAFGAKCSGKQLDKLTHLARYYCELTLIEQETFGAYLPSELAASALYLAMHQLDKEWTALCATECGYELSQLRACVRDMHACAKQAPAHTQQAIQDKYKQAKYSAVALIELKELCAAFGAAAAAQC